MNRSPRGLCLAILPIIGLAVGCETNDERLVEVAREASERQAGQNREIARQNQDLAEASKQLIKADAESRRELVALERDLQAERTATGRQRDELEEERRAIAQERYWDSQLGGAGGGAVGGAAILLVAALPLVLCWFLLRGMCTDMDDVISEILFQDFVMDPPSSASTALGDHHQTELLLPPDADEREAPANDGA